MDKSKVDHDKYFQNDRQFSFWVFYGHWLRQWMGDHSMKPTEFGSNARVERKHLYLLTQADLLYFIGLKYLEHSLVLTTAFPPTGAMVA